MAKNNGDLFQAKEGASFDYDGQPVYLTRGDLIREGHPLLSEHPDLWEPLKVRFEHAASEAAKGDDDETAKKDEKKDNAPASSVRADQRGARTRSA